MSLKESENLSKILSETLNHFHNRFKKLIAENKSTDYMVSNTIMRLGKRYDLNVKVPLIEPVEYGMIVSYTKDYVKISDNGLKVMIKNFTLTEIGMFFSLLKYISYDTNMLYRKESVGKTFQPLNKIKLKDILQITSEGITTLLDKCIEYNIMFKSRFDNKYAYFINPQFISQNADFDKINLEHHGNFKPFPKKFEFNLLVLDLLIFSKSNRIERKSIGKEKLGFLICLTLKMDKSNKIKVPKSINIKEYLRNVTKSYNTNEIYDSLLANHFLYYYEQEHESNLIINPNIFKVVSQKGYDKNYIEMFKPTKK